MTKQVRLPRNIDYDASAKFQSRLITLGILPPPGWEVYVTNSNCGRARINSKTCTVPTWAFNSIKVMDPDYCVNYAAHEITHAWIHHEGGDISLHNQAFYKKLKEICPPELWHHELTYKGTAANRAGIDSDPSVNEARKYGIEELRQPVKIAAGPSEDIYDAYVKANPKLAKRLTKIPAHERKGFIRGWAKLDK